MSRRFIRTDRGYLVNEQETQFVRRLNSAGNGGTIGDNDPVAASTLLIVTDTTADSLLTVDINTGVITTISDDNSIGPDFSAPVFKSGTTDTVYYVADTDTVYSVDKVTGERIVISSPTVPDGVNPIVSAISCVLDEANNRLLVSASGSFSGDGKIIGVSLVDGARTLVADGYADVRCIIDETRNVIVALNVSLTSEIYTFPIGDTGVNQGNLLVGGFTLGVENDLIYYSSSDAYLLVSSSSNGITSIDADTGADTQFSTENGNYLAYNAGTDTIYLANFDGSIRRIDSNGDLVDTFIDASEIGVLIGLGF